MAQALQGGCACRRISYTISIPDVNPSKHPHILIDTSTHSRAIHASPIPLLLRFPTPWLTSHTTSFFPDETHQSIRKIYTSPYEPDDTVSSVFCGYCGTQLWRWDTSDREAENWVCVTVGSLRDGEIEKFFGSDGNSGSGGAEDVVEAETPRGDDVTDEKMEVDESNASRRAEPEVERLRGAEWFEDLLGGSSSGPLGRISRLGVRQTQGGSTRVVEWEIVEWITESGERSATPGGKRKLDETGIREA